MSASNTVPFSPKLFTVEEVQDLKDRDTICVEQLISKEDEEYGYVTAKGWGVVCRSEGAGNDWLIVSIIGTFLPRIIKEIPYKAVDRESKAVIRYRFWSDKPTDEQSKRFPWR